MGLLGVRPRLRFVPDPQLGLLGSAFDDSDQLGADNQGWDARGGLLRVPVTPLPDATWAAPPDEPLTVRAGDFGGSLERIARARLGLDARQRDVNNYVGQLFEINGVDNARAVQPEQRIVLPDASTLAATAGLSRYANDIALGLQRRAVQGDQSAPPDDVTRTSAQAVDQQSGASMPVPAYRRVLDWLDVRNADGRAFYTDGIANAENGAAAVANTYGRSLQDAGYDAAKGLVNLYGLATDDDLRSRTFDGLKGLALNTLEHPLDTANAALDAAARYYRQHDFGEMGQDALRLAASGLATAGVGKTLGLAGDAAKFAGPGLTKTAQWLAPKADEVLDGYLERTGGKLYAVERGPRVPGPAAVAEAADAGAAPALATEDAAVANVRPGDFSIIDWSGFPEHPDIPKEVLRPRSPVRIVSTEDNASARRLAEVLHKELRRKWGLVGKDVEIHDIQPLKFGGSPTDLSNKIVLDSEFHQQVSAWWKKLQRDIESSQK